MMRKHKLLEKVQLSAYGLLRNYWAFSSLSHSEQMWKYFLKIRVHGNTAGSGSGLSSSLPFDFGEHFKPCYLSFGVGFFLFF